MMSYADFSTEVTELFPEYSIFIYTFTRRKQIFQALIATRSAQLGACGVPACAACFYLSNAASAFFYIVFSKNNKLISFPFLFGQKSFIIWDPHCSTYLYG